MDPMTVTLGALGIAFGLTTTVLRFVRPQALGKLEAMKRSFGDRAGTAVHWLMYSVVPVVVGTTLLVAGLNGVSLFG